MRITEVRIDSDNSGLSQGMLCGEILWHCVEDKGHLGHCPLPQSPRPLKEFDHCRPANGKNASVGIGWTNCQFVVASPALCLYDLEPKRGPCDTLNFGCDVL